MVKRIGVHLGGGASKAVERAPEVGANTVQIFSSSPRMWRAPKVDPKVAEATKQNRAKLDVGPLVIHANYLINVCSQTVDIREKSVEAFHGEIERAGKPRRQARPSACSLSGSKSSSDCRPDFRS